MEDKKEFRVNLYAFEGPLDLLYHLVKKAEVNIYDIPIAEITDEYMEHINEWKSMDIEVTSEFLVMATRLMEIKAKMLLPSSTSQKEEEEEEDPRENLIKQLVEYKFYKNVADNLSEKEKEQAKLYTKKIDIENKLQSFKEEPSNFSNLNIINLLESFNRVVERKKRSDKVENELNDIKKQKINVSVNDKKEFILNTIKKSRDEKVSFNYIIDDGNKVQEIIASFLALLDLVKENKIEVIQEGRFAPIWIRTPKLTASEK